jgi:hypothetical protein
MNILRNLKKDSRGFGHVETLLIVLVVAAVAGVGYFVYQNHKTSGSTTAHAGSYTSVVVDSAIKGGPVTILACYNGHNTVQVLAPTFPEGTSASTQYYSRVNNTTNGGQAENSKIKNATQLINAQPNDSLTFDLMSQGPGNTTPNMTADHMTFSLATCSTNVVASKYVGYGYTVSPLKLNATFSRASFPANTNFTQNGLGVTIQNNTTQVGGFEVKEANSGIQLLAASGGLSVYPEFDALFAPYDTANGTYKGSYYISLVNLNGKAGGMSTGPTIVYNVKVTN